MEDTTKDEDTQIPWHLAPRYCDICESEMPHDTQSTTCPECLTVSIINAMEDDEDDLL